MNFEIPLPGRRSPTAEPEVPAVFRLVVQRPAQSSMDHRWLWLLPLLLMGMTFFLGYEGWVSHELALFVGWSSLISASLVAAGYCFIRSGSLLLTAGYALFPLVCVLFSALYGDVVYFGDERHFIAAGERTAMMIQTGSGSGLVEMLSRWDVFELRYVLASYYHGLTFLTYGRNDPGILVTQATLHLSASLIMLLIGQQILRKRGNLTVLVLVFLYWPDFLQYMLTANRDLLVLLGVCLWLLGRRSLIHLQAAEGLAAGLAVLVLVLTRPILLLVVGVDALLILLLHARRGSAGMATGIAKLKLLPVAGFLGLAVVGILTDTGLGTSDLRTEEYVSQIASGYTKGAGRISGTLGGLTGIGLLISLPIRILISVYSPWPWTTGFQFESLTGFNNSVALLTLHVVKAIAACTGVLLFVVGTLRVWKLSAIRRWECQQWWYLVLAFLLSVAFAMPGYNRYIMMSYPALLVALLKLSESVPRAYMQRTVVGTTFGVMLGTMLMVLVY